MLEHNAEIMEYSGIQIGLNSHPFSGIIEGEQLKWPCKPKSIMQAQGQVISKQNKGRDRAFRKDQ